MNDAPLSTEAASPPALLLVGITAVLVLVLYIVSEIGNYYEIRRNWQHYQCQPSIAPFAKFYGHDPVETMNFCIGQAVKEHAGGVITPIYRGVEEVSSVISGAYDKVTAIEHGIGGLLQGFNIFVTNFQNSFRMVGVRVHMSLVSIAEIFQRVYAIFVAFTYAGISALTFGENLVCNPLTTFIGTIAGVDICCFAPETRIRMADGSVKPITEIDLGDIVAGGGEVTSLYQFDGLAGCDDMVSIDGVHVSGNHYLRREGGWIRADEHPSAALVPKRPLLWCLSTAANRIVAVGNNGDYVFTDYEECSDEAVITEAQRLSELLLNGRPALGPPISDYSLGLHPRTLIKMQDGRYLPIVDIQLGMQVDGGARVIGVVTEICESMCAEQGLSAAQLVFIDGLWQRAGTVWPVSTGTTIAHHLILGRSHVLSIRFAEEVVIRDSVVIRDNVVIRDYTEVGAAGEIPYLKVLSHKDK